MGISAARSNINRWRKSPDERWRKSPDEMPVRLPGTFFYWRTAQHRKPGAAVAEERKRVCDFSHRWHRPTFVTQRILGVWVERLPACVKQTTMGGNPRRSVFMGFMSPVVTALTNICGSTRMGMAATTSSSGQATADTARPRPSPQRFKLINTRSHPSKFTPPRSLAKCSSSV